MGAGGSGQTPRYPKGLPSGRAERLALEWGYPLGRRQTQGNADQEREREDFKFFLLLIKDAT